MPEPKLMKVDGKTPNDFNGLWIRPLRGQIVYGTDPLISIIIITIIINKIIIIIIMGDTSRGTNGSWVHNAQLCL